MTLPCGLAKLTNAANNTEARVDWNTQVHRAFDMGRGELVSQHAPMKPIHLTGWRQLDRCTKALREALDAATGETCPGQPSAAVEPLVSACADGQPVDSGKN